MSQKYPGGFITKSPVAPASGIASGMWTLDQAMQLKKQGVWPPLVSGAPTIGTATQTGAETATVTYTAPASNGGSTITLYTATSSPGGVTGTLSQAGSGTISISGLTTGTAYTFTVTATNAVGTSAASAASNSVTPVLTIGGAYQGGFYAGQISTAGNSVADYNLVIGPVASAESTKQWKNSTTATTGASSLINGPQNTADMVADGSSTVFPAAHFCNDLVTGGYSDWYMPAKNELDVCYYNLKPTTTSNNTGGTNGVNANAVPARASNYTAGTPAQTSATIFQTGNAEAFGSVSMFYWASTKAASLPNSHAAIQYFGHGGWSYFNITSSAYRVRAVRRVAV